MRTALALTLLCAFAPRAGALFVGPPLGQIAPSPDGRFVFVYVAAWNGTQTDPDEAAIREKCKVSGMYRRGEWDAPLWTMHPSGGGTFYTANDGVHLAVSNSWGPTAHFVSASSESRAGRARLQKKALELAAFDLIANGRYVRCVPAGEVIGSARSAPALNGFLESAAFGADGLFHVVSRDGNSTVWNPATGERVEGRGPNPVSDAIADVFTDPIQVALLVLGAFGLGVYCVARRRFQSLRANPRAE